MGHMYKYSMNYPKTRILIFGTNYHTDQTGSFSFVQIQQEQQQPQQQQFSN
jgi:hypothetical protein